MEIKQIPLRHLKCNEGQIEGLPTNPRQIDEEHLDKLKRSLQEAPEMLNLRELIVMPQSARTTSSSAEICACEQLNRKCLMMEYDPHYCDVIIARWEKLTGETAIKIE